MVADSVEIICSVLDAKGRRKVTTKVGFRYHIDLFNTAVQFSRRKWREATVDKLGLGDDAHEWLEAELDRAAAAADERVDLIMPKVVRMSDVEPQKTKWFWEGYFPSGALSILDGDPGRGKSQLTTDLASRYSRGDCMPPDLLRWTERRSHIFGTLGGRR